MADEWGPWINHDGKKYPVKRGEFVRSRRRSGAVFDQASRGPSSAWIWPYGNHPMEIIEYRVRQFSAMRDLKALVANPKQRVGT